MVIQEHNKDDTGMTDDKKLEEFAQIFRCTPEMAPTYVARIHERMGREIPMASIIAAMKKIAPRRLSMDTIIDRLTKMERSPAKTRAAKTGDDLEDAIKPSDAQGGSAAPSPPRSATRATRKAQKPSAMTQIGGLLAANWERGRKHGLKPPKLTPDRFIRTAQSLAGQPKPSVARVLEAIEKLDRRNILLTPNLVADEINESGEE